MYAYRYKAQNVQQCHIGPYCPLEEYSYYGKSHSGICVLLTFFPFISRAHSSSRDPMCLYLEASVKHQSLDDPLARQRNDVIMVKRIAYQTSNKHQPFRSIQFTLNH